MAVHLMLPLMMHRPSKRKPGLSAQLLVVRIINESAHGSTCALSLRFLAAVKFTHMVDTITLAMACTPSGMLVLAAIISSASLIRLHA